MKLTEKVPFNTQNMIYKQTPSVNHTPFRFDVGDRFKNCASLAGKARLACLLTPKTINSLYVLCVITYFLRRSLVNIPLSLCFRFHFALMFFSVFPVYINFSCSLFVARYHLKSCALVYDCYSKVGLQCFTIFRLYKVLSMPQIFSRARS